MGTHKPQNQNQKIFSFEALLCSRCVRLRKAHKKQHLNEDLRLIV
jgi:hypothetical protein